MTEKYLFAVPPMLDSLKTTIQRCVFDVRPDYSGILDQPYCGDDMTKQERAAEFLKEAEIFLKQAQTQTSTPTIQIKIVSLDGCRISGFPVALRTIGDNTIVVRADIQLSRADVRESLKFVMGVRVELEKEQPDEKRLKNAFMFYRDKVPQQIFRAVTSAIVTGGLEKVVW